MTDLILHHYPSSPFSEKIRLILGLKGLAWKSVLIPAIMPKPDVVALTGGYRKTPFLQIGADIYCDTALICDVLEHRQATPTLYPPALKGLARTLAQWADSTLFWAAMAYNFSSREALAARFPNAESAQAFAADRAAMSATMVRLRPGDATSAYKSYLRRLAHMLEQGDYLLGSSPSVADFAAYHPLWFTRTQVPVMAGILDATPGVLQWMDRLASIGHGQPEKLSATDAIALAQAAMPAPIQSDAVFQDDHGIPLGSPVTVTSESFGTEATEGQLIAATRTQLTLRRTDPRAGLVHVHFPRIGYVLRKAEP